MSTSLNIDRQNGNVPKSLPGEDHITGLVIYMAAGDIPAGFKTERVQALSTIDAAEAAGIVDYTTAADGTQTAAPWAVRVLHYHLSELYRINPAVSLYVGIFEKPQGDNMTFAEIKTVQNFADGRIRQIGVWCGDRVPSEDDLTAIQGTGRDAGSSGRGAFGGVCSESCQREADKHQSGRRRQMPCQRGNRPGRQRHRRRAVQGQSQCRQSECQRSGRGAGPDKQSQGAPVHRMGERIPHRHKPAGVRRRQAAARHGQSPGRAAGHGALSVLCDPAGAERQLHERQPHNGLGHERLRQHRECAHYGQGGTRSSCLPHTGTRRQRICGRRHGQTRQLYGGASGNSCRPRAGGYGKGRGTERLQSRDRPRPGRSRQQHG